MMLNLLILFGGKYMYSIIAIYFHQLKVCHLEKGVYGVPFRIEFFNIMSIEHIHIVKYTISV